MIQFESKEARLFILKENPTYILLNRQFYKSEKFNYLFGKLKYKKIGEINNKSLEGFKLLNKYNIISGIDGVLLKIYN